MINVSKFVCLQLGVHNYKMNHVFKSKINTVIKRNNIFFIANKTNGNDCIHDGISYFKHMKYVYSTTTYTFYLLLFCVNNSFVCFACV